MFSLSVDGIEQDLAQNARTFNGWFPRVPGRCNVGSGAAIPSLVAALLFKTVTLPLLRGLAILWSGPAFFYLRGPALGGATRARVRRTKDQRARTPHV